MCAATPKISVIMPVHNGERFITEAIESILDQTFEDFELLVIDDGSTDRSCERATSFQDRRIRTIRQPHRGLPVTLNVGLREARAKWVARMDTDDISYPDRLQRQWEHLQLDTSGIVVLGGGARLIDEHSADTGHAVTHPTDHSAIMRGLLFRTRGNFLLHPSVIILRSAALSVGGYRSILRVCEDVDLWLRLGRIGLLAALRQPVLLLRKHSANVSIVQSRLFRIYHMACVVNYHIHSATGIDIADQRPDLFHYCIERLTSRCDYLDFDRKLATWNQFKKLLRSRSLLQSIALTVRSPLTPLMYWHYRYCDQICQHVLREVQLSMHAHPAPSCN